MIKDYEIIRDGPVLTIVLGEELATGNAPALMEEVAGYKEQGVEKVVFDATRLDTFRVVECALSFSASKSWARAPNSCL